MKKDKIEVSVIVTTKNNESTIRDCLWSIKSQSSKTFELIVVDNFSSDSTLEISKEFSKKVFSMGPERSAQRNFGAKKSGGNYLFFVDSDMVLSKHVVRDCVNLVKNNISIKTITIPEKSIGSGFWSKCKALERSYYKDVEWMEAARFFHKNLFEKTGGFDEKLSAGEDFDLSQKISHNSQNYSSGRISSEIIHNEQQLSLAKTLKKKFYYGKFISTYQDKTHNDQSFKLQANPAQRFLLFFSDYPKLLSNPIIGIGMITMKSLEFIFGGFGYMIGFLQNKLK